MFDVTKIVITLTMLKLIEGMDESAIVCPKNTWLTSEQLQQLKKIIVIENIDFITDLQGSILSSQDVQNLLSNFEIYKIHSQLLNMSELNVHILTLLHEHSRLTMTKLEKLTLANRNTLKKHVNDLVLSGRILRHGKGKATWYTLPDKHS